MNYRGMRCALTGGTFEGCSISLFRRGRRYDLGIYRILTLWLGGGEFRGRAVSRSKV